MVQRKLAFPCSPCHSFSSSLIARSISIIKKYWLVFILLQPIDIYSEKNSMGCTLALIGVAHLHWISVFRWRKHKFLILDSNHLVGEIPVYFQHSEDLQICKSILNVISKYMYNLILKMVRGAFYKSKKGPMPYGKEYKRNYVLEMTNIFFLPSGKELDC